MSNNSYYNDAWRIINEKNQSLVSNYSMEFDGTNDFINCGNFAPFNVQHTKFSISLWCKSPNSFTDSGSLIESRLSYPTPNGIAIDFIDGSMSFRQTGSTFTKTIAEWGLNNTNWNHIVFAYDLTITNGNNVFVYINNATPPNRDIATTSQPATTADFKIGDGLRGNFNGQIDQVSIFDYTLSASQVATLHGGGTAVTNPMALSPKPISYYQLGDQTASNNTTEPTPAVQSYLVPNNSLQDYVFNYGYNSTYSYTRIETNDLSSLGAISVTTWFKYNSGIPSFATILQLENNIWIPNWSSTSQIRFQGAGGSTDRHIINTTFEVDRWYHLTLTYNGTSAKCYIDGDISKGFDVTAGNLNLTSSTKFNLGSTTSASNRWDGFISNTAMFNYELTSSQAILIYNNGTPSDLTSLNPIGWWKQNSNDIFLTNATGVVNFNILDYGSDSNNGQMLSAVSGSLQQGNLQHTNGFSPYALSLSGGGEFMYTNISALTSISTITTSIWIKLSTTNFGYALNINGNNSTEISFGYNSGKFFFYSGAVQGYAANPSSAGVWYNIVLTRSGDTQKMYINGVLEATATGLTTLSLNDYVLIGKRSNGFNIAADVSNLAIWSSELTTSQITTLYNQGLPSNLSTFSTKPIFWSQFGTNSSFNAAANRWTSIDEISGNNVLSHTVMAGDDITNGVGYSANGLGTSSIEIIGDAPYSTANGISNSMDVLSRSTDLPPTV